MTFIIDSKKYRKENLDFIDSINDTTSDEFVYYCETLYKGKNGEYILETDWLINPEWCKDEIKSGTMSKTELLPQTEYQIISPEEADNWLDMAIWNV